MFDCPNQLKPEPGHSWRTGKARLPTVGLLDDGLGGCGYRLVFVENYPQRANVPGFSHWSEEIIPHYSHAHLPKHPIKFIARSAVVPIFQL